MCKAASSDLCPPPATVLLHQDCFSKVSSLKRTFALRSLACNAGRAKVTRVTEFSQQRSRLGLGIFFLQDKLNCAVGKWCTTKITFFSC